MKRLRRKQLLSAAVAGAALFAGSPARAQIATLDKGHSLLIGNGLQIWGCDTGASSFTYSNLTGLNMNAVMWSYGQSKPGVLSTGQKWGKWVDYAGSPSTALDATEQAHYADIVAIQVGDEQESDIENPSGATRAWFGAAHAGNYFTDKLMYVNSTFVSDTNAFINFIANANPDALCWDAYPFGTTGVYPYNWLGKLQIYRRLALGNYIGASGTAPRPYGLYLQSYSGGDGARIPGDLEMRWQQFTAWTAGYTFVDAFSVGGGTSLFTGGNMSSPAQPRYDQFKESARQGKNLGPSLVRLISSGYGPNFVAGKDPSGATNAPPIDWPVFNPANAPAAQQYLTNVSAVNLGTRNGGHEGDVYVGFFNPLQSTWNGADVSGKTYFMITNALGAYLQDQSLLVTDCIQRITLDFDFAASGITALDRLRRSDGQVEVLPLTQVSGSQYRLTFDLEGGTGDLFKFDDGTPFVGNSWVPAQLVNRYWDMDANAGNNNITTGAGLGGSGTWDTSGSRWYNGSSDVPWTAGNNAIFWGTAGTVTLAAPQSARTLSFRTNGYTVTGSTLTLTESSVLTDPGVTATIGSVLAGTAGLSKVGSGTLILTNTANAYTGGTSVTGGVLQISGDGALGPAPGSLSTNITLDGGTLQFGGNFDLNNNRGIALGTSGGTIDTNGFTNVNGYTPDDGISGTANLTKTGPGTFFMNTASGSVNNVWEGNLIIKQGTWKIVNTGGLPINPTSNGVRAAQVTFDGGTLQIGASITASQANRGMTVAAGGGTIDTQGFNLSWPGPLAGTVATATLTKIGAGTLTFNTSSTASSYMGNLNVAAGTVALSGGTAMGDLASISVGSGATLNVTGSETIGSLAGAGNVTLGAITLTTGGNNNSTTFSGITSGAGGNITKTGTGAMSVTAANTYTGITSISAGTLRVNNTSGSGTGSGAVNVNGGTLGGTGTVSGLVTVNSGGHVDPGATNSAGTLNTSSVTLSTGALLDYDLASTNTVGSSVNDLLAITGSLTLGATLSFSLDAYNGDVANATYKLITYTGALAGNTSGWNVTGNNASGDHSFAFSTSTLGEIDLMITAALPPGDWLGSTNASWDTGSNWRGLAEPTAAMGATFPTPVPGTGSAITLTAGELAKSLTFNDTYTLSGGDLALANGTISVATGKTATINSVLGGTAGLIKNSSGLLVLGGVNTYSGGTTINSGSIRVSADNNLGNAGGGITFAGGSLNPTASFSTARAVTLNTGGGTIDNGAGITNTLAGSISGAAGNTLTKVGSGTLVLNQPSPRSGTSSSWLGDVIVSSGRLKVGSGASGGFLPGYDPIAYAGLPPIVPTITVAGGATLEFNHATGGATQDTAHAVVITGAGNVVISGAKTEIFVANNNYTGTTTINSGSSLRIGWGGASNQGGLGATAVVNSGSLLFSNDHNTTFPGSISGAGTFLKEYSGTLIETGADTSTGSHQITGGTLQIGNGGASGSISANITDNANLAFNRSDTFTHSSVISGTGSVTQLGTGTTVLSAANTYNGGTSINNGALRVSSDANLGAVPTGFTAGNITLNGGALQWGANFDLSNNRGITIGASGGIIDTQGFSNAAGYNPTNGFQGAGDLTKIGAGTFFASASAVNTLWTGNLILKQGTWKTNGTGGLPANPTSGLRAAQVTFDGGTLQFPSSFLASEPNRGMTVAAGGGNIDVASLISVTWAGPISGSVASATLTKTGGGLLRLNSSSTAGSYIGNTTVAAGTLRLDGGTALGDLSAVSVVGGATLNVTGSQTIGSLAGAGAATIGGNTLTTGGNGRSTTFSGVISGVGGKLTKTGAGTMLFTAAQTYTGATTAAGGKLRLTQSMTNSSALTIQDNAAAELLADGNHLIKTNSLSIAAAGALDLNDNDLVVQYGTNPNPFATIRDYVFAGYSASPDPSKTGIVSSTGQSAGNTILALFDNALVGASDWPPGSGMTIDANSVVGKYTYFGDMNLDGQVTADDYGILDANFGTTPPAGIAWLSGDANLDGSVTADDYGVLDANIGSGVGNPLAPAGATAVPEPAALGIILFGVLAARRRR